MSRQALCLLPQHLTVLLLPEDAVMSRMVKNRRTQ